LIKAQNLPLSGLPSTWLDGSHSMTLLYYDPIFQTHATGDHPENARRLISVVRHLNFVGLDSSCKRPSWPPGTVDQVCLVHRRAYLDQVEKFAQQGGGYIEADTVVSAKSHEVAMMAVGAVCNAVQRVVGGEDLAAFCLVRPPGHHALPDQAMGFCLFNSVAIAARVAQQELGIERILIVDFDVHHGNGTQAIFWEDPNVAYFSMHRSPFYPGTGGADEIGAGPGRGTTLNLPTRFGTSRDEQLSLFESALTLFAAKVKPQLVLISAGFDAHKDDPIGSLGLETEDFAVLTRFVLNISQQHADGKVVSVLEGGYNPQALAECVAIHIEELQADR
jgi:acetoin utilization deacetylase AcuC-like enzyme